MQGQLFTQDFLQFGIRETPPYRDLDDATQAAFVAALRAIFQPLSATSTLNEAQTESLVIERLLDLLGFSGCVLPQVNLSGKRREDVPDLLLFGDPAAQAAALAESKDDKRYRHGVALLEAKRWLRPLDRGDAAEPQDPGAPSSQMLRYLSRADVASDRRIKWGVLTNGAVWRLYWQDARSRAEEFFELDVALLLGVPGAQGELLDGLTAEHGLRLLRLLFAREAFLPQAWESEGRTLHAFARNEGRLYEEKVAADLGARVFDDIFPSLAFALAKGDLQAVKEEVGYGQFKRQRYTAAYLDEVREATLILLYRLLFLFYAEDRRLLPVGDERYRPYSVRALREEVRDKVDAGAKWSSTMTRLWLSLKGAFWLIDSGDDSIGMPAYNGGLFNRARSLLLERTGVADAVLAPIIDAMSRRTEEVIRGWINYRDLSVSHLGGIYERLLEYSLVHEVQAEDDYRDKPEIDRIVARPASFARKVSGSYYTHDDLVRLILRESVGLLAKERTEKFDKLVNSWKKKPYLSNPEWDQLDKHDPASAILELKVCDPAMGSGHFLVALVDDLADRVLEAINAAQLNVAAQSFSAIELEKGRPWQSPVLKHVAAIRAGIKREAKEHGWAVTDTQLDDRHIVRRMVLKKCIFGVDKNLMAVELAKTALWLHTFTVGAPLSFLDHHLKWGDSLHGERLDDVLRSLQGIGTLFHQSELQRLELSAANLGQVAVFTDADIAEVRQSKALTEAAELKMAPLNALLDFWRAMRWLHPQWPPAKLNKLDKVADDALRDGLLELLSPGRDLVAVMAAGKLDGKGAGVAAANVLLQRVRELAARERFLHWWTAFPNAFGPGKAGFDAVIGNPPWDRIKLQEVEWFAEREPAIATHARAADRKAAIQALRDKKSTLADDYDVAVERAEANARVLAKAGDYPLLGGGDVNLYSLFVERAQSLIRPDGLVAILTPSGIAADKGAAAFFKSIATTGRLGALFDFENRKVFFPDVDSRFKFCTLVFGGPARKFQRTRCAFFMHSLDELDAGKNTLELSAADFERVNPNTGAAPVFRTRRDADITMRMYATHPVLVRHGGDSASLGRLQDQRAWPVQFATMFHMTNDSDRFLTIKEAASSGQSTHPLYEGKMVQMFDHRAADVVLNSANLHRAAQPETIAGAAKADPARLPIPQYRVLQSDVGVNPWPWALGFKEITAPTNVRTMIAAVLPGVGFGNKLPLLLPQCSTAAEAVAVVSLLAANLNAFAFDFVLRQKLQGQTINLFILEQLPVIAPAGFERPLPPAFTQAMRTAGLMNGHHANPTVADFVIPQVLALSYTAHDLAPFARDLGYVDEKGDVLPPIVWNDEDRRARMAALDALFFHLYGIDENDAEYIFSTFPIVRQQDTAAFGRYRTRDDVLALMKHFPAA